jgi:hypothetical protein
LLRGVRGPIRIAGTPFVIVRAQHSKLYPSDSRAGARAIASVVCYFSKTSAAAGALGQPRSPSGVSYSMRTSGCWMRPFLNGRSSCSANSRRASARAAPFLTLSSTYWR